MKYGRIIAECMLLGSVIGFATLVAVQHQQVQHYKTLATALQNRPTPTPIHTREFVQSAPAYKPPCDGTGRMFNRDGQPCEPAPQPQATVAPTISKPISCYSNGFGNTAYTTCN